MEGRLQPIVDALITHYQAEQLKAEQPKRRDEAARWLDRGEAAVKPLPHPERARRDAEICCCISIGKNKAWLAGACRG